MMRLRRTVASLIATAMCLMTLSIPIAAKKRPYTITVVPVGDVSAFIGNLNDKSQVVASTDRFTFIWDAEHGVFHLPTPPGTLAFASAINNRGHVAGWIYDQQTDDGSFPPPVKAFRWDPKKGIQVLGSESGFTSSQALAINDRDEVVGTGFKAAPFFDRAFLWPPVGRAVELPSPHLFSIAFDINNRGVIVGFSGALLERQEESHIARWPAPDVYQDLGLLDPNGVCVTFSQALAINDRGWVVGVSSAPVGGAFLWTPKRGLQNLGYMPVPPNDFPLIPLTRAIDVNNAGEVIGFQSNVIASCTDEGGTIPFSEAPFIWDRHAGMRDLRTLISNYEASDLNAIFPYHINDRGDILVLGRRNDNTFPVLLLESHDHGNQ